MEINVKMQYDELKEFMDFKKDNKYSREKLIQSLEKSLSEFEKMSSHTMEGNFREISFLKKLISGLKNER
jgi:hypothetical protein